LEARAASSSSSTQTKSGTPGDHSKVGQTVKEHADEEWDTRRASPGALDEPRQTFCLHSLPSDSAAAGLSRRVLKGLYVTSGKDARRLVREGRARDADDFWTYVGYVGWRRNQLQAEMDRGDWLLASADSGTVRRELLKPGAVAGPSVPKGIDEWEVFMYALGRTKQVAQSRLGPSDGMLADWIAAHLLPSQSE